MVTIVCKCTECRVSVESGTVEGKESPRVRLYKVCPALLELSSKGEGGAGARRAAPAQVRN